MGVVLSVEESSTADGFEQEVEKQRVNKIPVRNVPRETLEVLIGRLRSGLPSFCRSTRIDEIRILPDLLMQYEIIYFFLIH
tara:strand:+ start:8025 stop:8267 length:243 start_codon:yes stop_codon:yes gene_type:complete